MKDSAAPIIKESEHQKTGEVCNPFDEMGFFNLSDDEATPYFFSEWHSVVCIILKVARRDSIARQW